MGGMTLVPALRSPDEFAVPGWEWSAISEADPVAAAVLDLKRHPDSREAFQALRPHAFVDVDLLCIDGYRATQGHIVLDYAVEAYRQGREALDDALAPRRRLFGRELPRTIPEAVRLYRVTHAHGERPGAGVWWAGSAFDARREGAGRSEDPVLFTAMVPTEHIWMRTRTRFGKGGTSPAEYAVDDVELTIEKVDA